MDMRTIYPRNKINVTDLSYDIFHIIFTFLEVKEYRNIKFVHSVFYKALKLKTFTGRQWIYSYFRYHKFSPQFLYNLHSSNPISPFSSYVTGKFVVGNQSFSTDLNPFPEHQNFLTRFSYHLIFLISNLVVILFSILFGFCIFIIFLLINIRFIGFASPLGIANIILGLIISCFIFIICTGTFCFSELITMKLLKGFLLRKIDTLIYQYATSNLSEEDEKQMIFHSVNRIQELPQAFRIVLECAIFSNPSLFRVTFEDELNLFDGNQIVPKSAEKFYISYINSIKDENSIREV